MEITTDLISAVQQVESGGDPNAVSEAGAVGLMQLNPDSFPDYTPEQLKDPVLNKTLGITYLENLFNRYGNVEDALSAYHAGPGNFDAWVEAGRPEEGFGNYGIRSLGYVDKVMSEYDRISKETTSTPVPQEESSDEGILDTVSGYIFDDDPADVKAWKAEYYNPDNMVEYHPELIAQARNYYRLSDEVATDEEIADKVVSTMRNFDSNTLGTISVWADLKGASQARKQGFAAMLDYWADAPDMFDYMREGDWSNTFESFATNVARGVLDPVNWASMGAGMAAGAGARTALQGILKSAAAGLTVDVVGGVGQEGVSQATEKEVDARESYDYEQMAVTGALNAAFTAVPTGIAVARNLKAKPGEAPEYARYTDVTPEDLVEAVETVPLDLIHATHARELGEEASGLYKSINLDKITDALVRGDFYNNLEALDELPSVSVAEQQIIAKSKSFDALTKAAHEKVKDLGLAIDAPQVIKLRDLTVKSMEDARKLHDKYKSALRSEGARGENTVKLLAARNYTLLSHLQLLSRTRQSARNISYALAAFKTPMPSQFEATRALDLTSETELAGILETAMKAINKGKPVDGKVVDSVSKKVVDGFMEAWYNGILGAMDTIAVNAFGAVTAGFLKNIVERPLAAGFAKMIPGAETTLQGAMGGIKGYYHPDSLMAAARMASHFVRSENPAATLVALEARHKKILDKLREKHYTVTVRETPDGPVETVVPKSPGYTVENYNKIKEAYDYYKGEANEFRLIGTSEFFKEAAGGKAIPWYLGGRLIRIPGALMGATDSAARVLGRRSAMQFYANNEAIKQGLTPNTAAYREFIEKKLNKPTNADKKRALQEAERMTFQHDNWVSDMLKPVLNDDYVGPFARLFMPFSRTPINLISYGMARLPGVGLAFKDVPLEERLGRQVLGGAIFGTTLYLANQTDEEGNPKYFTTSKPGKLDYRFLKHMREGPGWAPWTYVAEGEEGELPKYVDFNRLDPLSWIVQSALAFHALLNARNNVADTVPEESRDRFDTLIAAYATEFGKSVELLVMGRSYFGGLAELMEMLSPEGEGKLSDFMISTLAGVIPNMMNRIGQAGDEYARQVTKGSFLENLSGVLQVRGDVVTDPLDAGRETLPLKFNQFGRPVRQSQGYLMGAETNLMPITRAFKQSVRGTDPQGIDYDDTELWELYLKTGVDGPKVPEDVFGVKIESNREYSLLEQIYGDVYRQMLEGYKPVIQSYLEAGETEVAIRIMKDVVKSVPEIAKIDFINSGALTDARALEFAAGPEAKQYNDFFYPRGKDITYKPIALPEKKD